MWQIRASSNAGVTSSLKYISFFFLKKNIIFICNYFKMHASTTDFEMRELVLAVKIVISQVILFCKFFVTKFWNKSVFVRWQMSLIIIFWFENIISKTVSIKQKRTFSRIWMRRWMHWLQHCNYRMCKFFLSFFLFFWQSFNHRFDNLQSEDPMELSYRGQATETAAIVALAGTHLFDRFQFRFSKFKMESNS